MTLLRGFWKNRAQSLPLHRPYSCAIELLPGTPLPTNHLYSLFLPERKAIEKYISESLSAGIIPPLEWRRVFLCGKKKDKTLPSCIDYCGLNKNTIKNKYPLPLLTFAFELLQGVTIFSKLDLRNAYHLVHFREGEEWKTPTWGISSTWLCPSA